MPQLTYEKEITGLVVIDRTTTSFRRAAKFGIG
jgi:hypothetical protein